MIPYLSWPVCLQLSWYSHLVNRTMGLPLPNKIHVMLPLNLARILAKFNCSEHCNVLYWLSKKSKTAVRPFMLFLKSVLVIHSFDHSVITLMWVKDLQRCYSSEWMSGFIQLWLKDENSREKEELSHPSLLALPLSLLCLPSLSSLSQHSRWRIVIFTLLSHLGRQEACLALFFPHHPFPSNLSLTLTLSLMITWTGNKSWVHQSQQHGGLKPYCIHIRQLPP